jgi:hypothetical protein
MPETTTTATSPVRLRDWQLLYEAFITQRFATPFAWGTQDCCTFAADCVLAITGVDVAHPDLRLHRTQAQAAATLARMGGVKRIATAALGPHRGAQFASVGDVVMVTMPDPSGTPQKALAVCNGANAWVPSSLGLVPVSLRDAIWCWRVG